MPLNKIPPVVQNAVLSAEDRTFYTNQGISVTGVVRAALNNLRGGATQGGSTITQQYVKNAYSSITDRSYTPQDHEFFISLKAARELYKDQILERYLNIIYFGRGCYGVEAASECYFHKDVAKLTPSEAAYLAGIINGPELYDSGTAMHRGREGPLDLRPRRHGHAGVAVAGARQAQRFPKIQPQAQATRRSRCSVPAALRHGDGAGPRRRSGHQRKRTAAERLPHLPRRSPRWSTTRRARSPRRSAPARSGCRDTQVAIATIDARTGALVSVYAGDGKRSRNAVTQDTVQAGSTFKPFALVAGLEGKRDAGDCSPKALRTTPA